jgi:hypothetical protein
MMNETLLCGWWSIQSWVTSLRTIPANIGAWWRFKGLVAPHLTPGVIGIAPRPLPAGSSLWRRPGVYLSTGILTVCVWSVVANSNANRRSPAWNDPSIVVPTLTPTTTPTAASLVGSCLDLTTTGIRSVVSCVGAHDAYATKAVSQVAYCPFGTTDYFTSRSDGTVLCVERGL